MMDNGRGENRDADVIVSPNAGVSTNGPPGEVADPEVGLPLAEDEIVFDPLAEEEIVFDHGVQSKPPRKIHFEQETRSDDDTGGAIGEETSGSKLKQPNPGCAYRHKLDDLINWLEIERQKHLLAFAYFSALQFYLLFLPITFITLTSGILSVSVTKIESAEEEFADAALKSDLIFLAGILSFFTTFFNAVQEKLRYSSRTEMHEAAALQLKNMRFTLDALMVDAELEDNMSPEADMKNVKELEALRHTFLMVMDSCNSIIPTAINEPFNLMKARVAALYRTNDKIRGIYGDEVKIYRLSAIEVGSVVSSFKWTIFPFFPFCFPLILPFPEHTCCMAIERLQNSLLDGSAMLDDLSTSRKED
jgi:hypothetical protein